MDIVLLILAIGGIAAVLRHILTASSKLLRRGLDAYLAGQIADVRANRGDLTGLSDAQDARVRARRLRRGALFMMAVWVALLVVPPLTPWPELLYASYTILWFVPRRGAAR
jgi:hypothetical protein